MIPTLQLGQIGRGHGRGPAPDYVKILAHMEGANGASNFVDSSIYARSMGPLGNVQIDTENLFLGRSTALFDGDHDGFSIADAAELRPGTGDFSFKFFHRPTSFANYVTLISKGYVTAGSFLAQAAITTGRISVYAGGSLVIAEPGSALTSGQGYFVEIARVAGTMYLYRDSVLKGSASNSTNINSTAILYVGGGDSTGFNNYFLAGNLGELLYCVGAAPDVGVVPTEPFWSL